MAARYIYRRPYDARIRRGLPIRLIGGTGFLFIGAIFVFTDANWNDDLEFFLEVSIRATSGTASARLYDLTTLAAVANSTISTTSGTLSRVRSSALTLVDGREYRVQVGHVTGDAGAITGAKLIVT